MGRKKNSSARLETFILTGGRSGDDYSASRKLLGFYPLEKFRTKATKALPSLFMYTLCFETFDEDKISPCSLKISFNSVTVHLLKWQHPEFEARIHLKMKQGTIIQRHYYQQKIHHFIITFNICVYDLLNVDLENACTSHISYLFSIQFRPDLRYVFNFGSWQLAAGS